MEYYSSKTSRTTKKGDHFVGLGSKEVRQRVQFAKAGEQHLLQVRIWNDSNGPVNIPPEIPGGLRVGASPVIDEEEEIRAAAALAASCDSKLNRLVHQPVLINFA